MGSFKHYRDIVIVVLLLALPFFFLRSSIRRPEDTSWVDRTLLHVAAPFQYFAALLARGVSGLVGDYVYLVDVKADNNRLAYENANLRSKVSDSERTEADNRRLRRLLGLRETMSQELVSAVVVGKDTTEYFRVAHLTVDTKNAVIRPEMPVISVDGTVGTVLRVAGEKVDVQLTVDSGFGVDVMVERTGARGFVRGIGDRQKYSARVEYVQRTRRRRRGRRVRHQRLRLPLSARHSRGARQEGREAQLRHLSIGRSRADRGFLAPRRGDDHPDRSQGLRIGRRQLAVEEGASSAE